MPFGDRNDRISLKTDDSPGESFPLTYFQSKICTNLPQTEFCRKKKNDHRNKNFEKNAMLEAKTMEFGWKTMNLLRSPICWPISNQKVAPIWANRNFGKKKRALKQKFLKNTMSQAETTQVCQKNDDSTKESFPLTYF